MSRFKNKTFTITMSTMIITFIYQILSIFGVVPKISENIIIELTAMFINILAAVGIFNNNAVKEKDDE